MKRLFFVCLLIACALFSNLNYLQACAIVFNQTGAKSAAISYNMDWFWLGGGMFTRAAKEDHRSLSWEKGAMWKSKYKSIVLSTLTDDQPFSGVNEKGLTVHCLGTPLQITDNRKGLPALNELEAINYILDTAKDVTEAKAQLAKVKISPIAFPLHYFICDKKECIAVDFQGKMKITSLKKNQRILTNSYYADAFKDAQIGVGADGDGRFKWLMQKLYENPTEVREAVRSVEQDGIISTMWNSTINYKADGSTELVIDILPNDMNKHTEVSFDVDEIFAGEFEGGKKWISFDSMIKGKNDWKTFTKEDAKKLIKSNIKKISENKHYVLARNESPENAASNVKNLEKVLLDIHTNDGENCLEIMKEFL